MTLVIYFDRLVFGTNKMGEYACRNTLHSGGYGLESSVGRFFFAGGKQHGVWWLSVILQT
jgi:hypothetical protein